MANSDTRNSPKESRSLKDILGGYCSISGSRLSPFILSGLWPSASSYGEIPIFPTTGPPAGSTFIIWYAASLIPKIVVIGTGVRLLSISLLSTILIMSVAAITLHLLREWNVVKGWVKHEKQQNTVSGWKRLNK